MWLLIKLDHVIDYKLVYQLKDKFCGSESVRLYCQYLDPYMYCTGDINYGGRIISLDFDQMLSSYYSSHCCHHNRFNVFE